MKKTYEEIYNEVINYINGDKHNKPCMLQSIKKEFRTPEIIRLIFDNPKIFNLDAEFLHIPEECLTERLVMEFVLRNPKRLSLYDDGQRRDIIISKEKQTLPVLVAFECSKRLYENLSRKAWGIYYEKVRYSAKTEEYKSVIIKYCNEVEKQLSKKHLNGIYDASIEELIDAIGLCCEGKNLESEEVYVQKYKRVNLGNDKKIIILVSGAPDSGKSTFSRELAYVIRATHFSSDYLHKRGLIAAPIDMLVNEERNCVIFSDTDAYRFFKKDELADCVVINVLVMPSSYIDLHSHSKYNSKLDFKTHINDEIKKYRYDEIENPIIVINDYTDNIAIEIDKAVEEILRRLNVYKDDESYDEIGYSKQKNKIIDKESSKTN